jgi:hypothetical protein
MNIKELFSRFLRIRARGEVVEDVELFFIVFDFADI